MWLNGAVLSIAGVGCSATEGPQLRQSNASKKAGLHSLECARVTYPTLAEFKRKQSAHNVIYVIEHPPMSIRNYKVRIFPGFFLSRFVKAHLYWMPILIQYMPLTWQSIRKKLMFYPLH